MELVQRLEVHYRLKDGLHSMDAIVRNRCEAEFLAAMKYITEQLGVRLVFEATVPTEGGFRDTWRAIWSTEAKSIAAINTSMVLLTALITCAVTTYNAPPKPNPKLEQQQMEINELAIEKGKLENEKEKLENDKAKLENEKLEIELAKTRVAAAAVAAAARPASPSSPEEFLASRPTEVSIASALVPAAPTRKLGLQMDWKVRKLRSEFYKIVIDYDRVEAVGFNWQQEDKTHDQIFVPRREFWHFVLQTDKLDPETTEAVIEIFSPVITDQGELKWKGRYKDKTISFSMDDKHFRSQVTSKRVSFQHGDYIKCILEIEKKLDDAGEIQVAGYRVVTVLSKDEGGIEKETPQGRQKKFEDKFGKQDDIFGNGREPSG